MAGTERIGAFGIVDLFLSTFEHRIDKKGRLSVPALSDPCSNVARPALSIQIIDQPCLEGCGPERIDKLWMPLKQWIVCQQRLQPANDAIKRARNETGPEGRIMLNTDFIAFAKLDDQRLCRHWSVFSDLATTGTARELTCARAKPRASQPAPQSNQSNIIWNEIIDAGTNAPPIRPIKRGGGGAKPY